MFTREHTKAIKGIAVVLMLLHHIAGFPERFPVGFEGFSSIWTGFVDEGYLEELAKCGKICVPVFFFLGGYGLYKRWESGKFSLSGSIVSQYKQYWKVFAVFVPVAFLFFARTGDDINSLATRYTIVTGKDYITALISNFLGYSSSFNGEWYILLKYICALPLGYLLLMAIKDHQSFLKDMFIVIVLSIVIYNVFPNLNNTQVFANINSNMLYDKIFLSADYVGYFCEGIVFAKYDMLAALKKKVKCITLEKMLCGFGIAAVLWCRMYMVGGGPADIIYVPALIVFASDLLDGSRVMNKIFLCLGKHSANMWYIHSFYCYYFLEVTKIVYSTRSVWIDLLILILLSLASSVLLESIYGWLKKLWDTEGAVQATNE